MAHERPPAAAHPDDAEVVDPEPGGLDRPTPAAPSRANGAVDGLLDATARVVTPFVRLGWRTARGVGRRLGVNDAVRHQVDRALDSDTAARTTEQVLESDAANQVWDKVLESQEAQKLVERVAEAPEVRSAITSQGLGMLEDVRQTARRAARRLDDELERLLRKARRKRAARATADLRGRRHPPARDRLRRGDPEWDPAADLGPAGAAAERGVLPQGDPNAATIAFGVTAWLTAAGFYLGLFWILAERTPGMNFFALRISTESGGRVGPRQDIRRLIGFALALIPFGLGFLGILTNERRRGWHDRFADTVVLYADPELDSGLPGWTPPPFAAERSPSRTKR